METKDRWWLGSASLSGEEYPYLLRKLEYRGTTFNNASLTTKAAQLRLPLPLLLLNPFASFGRNSVKRNATIGNAGAVRETKGHERTRGHGRSRRNGLGPSGPPASRVSFNFSSSNQQTRETFRSSRSNVIGFRYPRIRPAILIPCTYEFIRRASLNAATLLTIAARFIGGRNSAGIKESNEFSGIGDHHPLLTYG